MNLLGAEAVLRNSSSGCFELLHPALANASVESLWQQGDVWQPSGGRRPVQLVVCELGEGVRKHYQRGGLLGRILTDRYWYRDLESSRSFSEFRLLAALHAKGLPVPMPIAARVCVDRWTYGADLITQRLQRSQSLHDALSAGAGSLQLARLVGELLARFHRCGVYHADLNAHNLLIGEQGLFLIDFDRSQLLAPHARWQSANIGRLKRSLRKLGHLSDLPSEAVFWRPMVDHYRRCMSAA